MPAMMTCPSCGFDGPHGFNEPYVGGIVHFYHTSGACEGAWEVRGKWFKSLADAWTFIRPYLARDGASKVWLSAWDARIVEKDEDKAQRLFKQWKDSY